jgi:glutathione S-transferase
MMAIMLTIWGRSNAFNVQKVVWATDEIGLDYERVDAGRGYPITETPEFHSLNPNRRVPVIRDGDFVLWESNAILRYLCGRYSAGVLHPECPFRRADADRWMDWAMIDLFRAYRPAFNRFSGRAPESVTPEEAEASFSAANRLLSILDEKLARDRFLAGETFTMGDIPAGLVVHNWLNMGREIPGLPNVREWYARLAGRPGAAWAFAAPII